jgi:hypothetical protein
MVGLGEDPAVTAGRDAEVEPGAVGEAVENAGRHRHLGLDRGRRDQRLGPAGRAGGRAGGAVGRHQEPGPQRAATRLDRDVAPLESDPPDRARRPELGASPAGRLGEREVERRAQRHVDQRGLPLHGHGDVGVHEARLDPGETPLDRDPEAGRQRVKRARDDTAAAGLAPGERRPVEQGDVDARLRQEERRRGARGPGSHDGDVHRATARRRPAGRAARGDRRQRPFHSARRFSRNARTPSWKSSLR